MSKVGFNFKEDLQVTFQPCEGLSLKWEETPGFLDWLVPKWPKDDSIPSMKEYHKFVGKAKWEE